MAGARTADAIRAAAWRTFVAVTLPADVIAVLDARLAPLRAAHPEARWSPLAAAHLTLVFLGPTPSALIPTVLDAVAGVVAGQAPFRVALDGAGSFGGRRRPRVAWIGVGAGTTELVAIAARIRDRLAGLRGLERLADAGELRPHLTIARQAPGSLAPRLRAAFGGEGPAWVADRLVLFRSHLGRDGARHESLGTVPLAASGAARDVRS